MKKLTFVCIVIAAVSIPSLVFAEGPGPMQIAGADAGHALDVAGAETGHALKAAGTEIRHAAVVASPKAAQAADVARQDAWKGLEEAGHLYRKGWKDTQGDPVGTTVDGTARVGARIAKEGAIDAKGGAVIIAHDYDQAFKDHMSNESQKDAAHAFMAIGAGSAHLGKDIGHGFKHLFAHFQKKKARTKVEQINDSDLLQTKAGDLDVTIPEVTPALMPLSSSNGGA